MLIEPIKKYIEHGLVRKERRVNIIIFNKFPNAPKMIWKIGIIWLIQNAAEVKFAIRLKVEFDMASRDKIKEITCRNKLRIK